MQKLDVERCCFARDKIDFSEVFEYDYFLHATRTVVVIYHPGHARVVAAVFYFAAIVILCACVRTLRDQLELYLGRLEKIQGLDVASQPRSRMHVTTL